MPQTQKNTVFPTTVSIKECSDTGMAMVLIALLLYLFFPVKALLLCAIALLIVNMTMPALFKLFAIAWLGFSHLLGTVMSKIILTGIFFGIVTPLALLRRTLGHDPMQLKRWKGDSNTVFVKRDHTYTPNEIERPY